ncbi:ABC transporter ATP-binding protein [Cerasicoccus maritimus]|uniref:ABC transporter ATP-binding protein n=1 Tax=Cerasicoccus maritimus TaxID=490089 RepID=UPI002852CB47|nr:sn-glycerol-3-phosphate ABC transporter ATP-binding protein UgpC [Cerasicoccus maritimus]
MGLVNLNNLVKEYQDSGRAKFTAVKGINLEIEQGEFMILVGPSGCGKSTTLRMIAGLENVTSGTIEIDGRVVNSVAPKDRDIAMVFQNYALYPHMSVFDNMAFGLKLQKFPRGEIRNRVHEAAEILGLESMLERKPKQMSGGQRQRVALGRAIVRKPKVFLFDEPLSNLDAKMRVQMRTEISRLHSRLQATMIYVTHDQVEAMTMGDRICVMKEGEIMQVDDPISLYQHPNNIFTAGFIGSPPMNFFSGKIEKEGNRFSFVEENMSAAPFRLSLDDRLTALARNFSGRKIMMGVRPEDIGLRRQASGCEVDAEVMVVEPMGSETYLYFNTGRHDFIGRFPSENHHRIGERARVVMDIDKIHLFDADTMKKVS